jgi:hypothetical protein
MPANADDRGGTTGGGTAHATLDTLRFPVPSRPLPAHPPPSVDMILAASEAMLPVWNADPRREATRLAQKCRVRFVLAPAD